MKKYVVSSAVSAAFFVVCMAWTCLSSRPAVAQPPVSSGAQVQLPPIALVDIGFILKNHVRLAAGRKDLTTEAEKLQKEVEEQMRQVNEDAKKLGPGGLKAGTQDYNDLEAKLVAQKAAIQTSVAHKRREFTEREAHLVYNAYVEINQVVRQYCQQRGIVMVLNFSHETIRDDSPETIVRGSGNPVVYFHRDLDITPYVMQPFIKPLPPEGPAAFTPPTQR